LLPRLIGSYGLTIYITDPDEGWCFKGSPVLTMVRG